MSSQDDEGRDEPLVRACFTLTRAQIKGLDLAAELEGASRSAVARKAIDGLLADALGRGAVRGRREKDPEEGDAVAVG